MSRYNDIVNNRGKSKKGKILEEPVKAHTEDTIKTKEDLIATLYDMPSYTKQKKFMKEYASQYQDRLNLWYDDVHFQDAMKSVIKPKTKDNFVTEFMRLGTATDDNPREAARSGGSGLSSTYEWDRKNEELRVKEQQHKRPDIGRGRYG